MVLYTVPVLYLEISLFIEAVLNIVPVWYYTYIEQRGHDEGFDVVLYICRTNHMMKVLMWCYITGTLYYRTTWWMFWDSTTSIYGIIVVVSPEFFKSYGNISIYGTCCHNVIVTVTTRYGTLVQYSTVTVSFYGHYYIR